MAEDVSDSDEFYKSAGTKPLDQRLNALQGQAVINGFPDPANPTPDPDNDVWFGV